MNTILFTISTNKNISILLNPIIPSSTEKVLKTINISMDDISIEIVSKKDLLSHNKELKTLDIYLKRLKMIIDSHCHLTYEPMILSLKETVKRANDDGIKYLLTISTEDKSYKKILSVDDHKCVFGTYGIHPHEAKYHQNITYSKILENLDINQKIIGIGETGLDFYYNNSESFDQIKFSRAYKAAQISKKPLIVHTRAAGSQTLKILKEAKKKNDFKLLIHCFTGSKKFAFDLLDLGAYMSASGVVTFKKSQDLANTFKEIPNDRILVETDAPILAPVPLRGKPNEPSYIIHTVKFLSEMKKFHLKNFSILLQKFFNLFGKLN